MNIPSELKQEILSTLDKSELAKESSHALNTLYWVKKINSEASLALQIAALGHDLERGRSNRYKVEDFKSHSDYKMAHSEMGAKMLKEMLKKHNIDKLIINKAVELVRLHEVGGNIDADVLRDADSISFFDNNLEFYLTYKGPEGTKRQIDYKFNRCSKRAQKYIRGLNIYKKFKIKLAKF